MRLRGWRLVVACLVIGTLFPGTALAAAPSAATPPPVGADSIAPVAGHSPAAQSPADRNAPDRPASPDGTVSIDGGALVTHSFTVTLDVPATPAAPSESALAAALRTPLDPALGPSSGKEAAAVAAALQQPATAGTAAPPAVTSLRLSNNGHAWTTRPYTPTLTWSLRDVTAGGSDMTGRRTVWVQWGDEAGNWSVVKTAAIRVTRDAAPPVPAEHAAASAARVATEAEEAAPSAPQDVTARMGAGILFVHWKAPASGIAASYSVIVSPGGLRLQTKATQAFVAGVRDGVRYTVRVTAANEMGKTSAAVTAAVEPGPAAKPAAAAPAAEPAFKGKVTAGGVGVAGITVWPYGSPASATTDSNGNYSVSPGAGTWVLSVSDAQGRYVSGFYKSGGGFTFNYDEAAQLTLGSTDVTANVPLPITPHISGTVTDPHGAALGGIAITAGSYSSGFGSYTSTDTAGHYQVAVLPSDSYAVGATDYSSLYVTCYYRSSGGCTTNPQNATAVAVGTSDVTGKDIQLALGIHIAGTVAVSGGGTVPTTYLVATSTTGEYAAGYSAPSGDFSLLAVPGTYTIAVYPGGPYPDGWYNSGTGFTTDGAAKSSVVATADVGNVHIVLPAPTQIRGTLTKSTGGAAADIDVCAYGSQSGYTCGTSGSDGTYSVDVVPNDAYAVSFSDDSGVLLGGFWGGGTTVVFDYADAVQVSVGSSPATVNATIPVARHISGKVTGTSAGSIEDVDACALTSTDQFCITVAADGTYTIAVPPDRFPVYFEDQGGTYLAGYYTTSGFNTDPNAASLVDVRTADKSGIDVTLVPAPHIKGTIKNASGVGVPNLLVRAFPDEGSAFYMDTTAKGGTYSIAVGAGSYEIEIWDPAGRYLAGYYSASGFTTQASQATAVTVAAADVTVNVDLPACGHILGKVTGVGAGALGGIYVSIDGDSYSGEAITASDGTYMVAATPGAYRVSFADYGDDYIGGFYAAAGFTTDPGAATDVVVNGTGSVYGINVVLPVARHIKGTVTGAGGAGPLNTIVVTASSGTYSASSWTNTDGTYSVPVPQGSFAMGYRDYFGVYATGVRGAAGFTRDTSAAVPIPVGSTDVAGIDIVLPLNPTISGTVTGAGHGPLAGIIVSTSESYATTDAAGKYTTSVDPGTYLTMFEDTTDTYASGYYSSHGFVYRIQDATPVTVGTSNVTGISVTLPVPVHIKGTVKGPTGTPLSGIEVTTYDTVGGSSYATTAANGTYSVIVPAGKFRVGFYDRQHRYLSGYYSTRGFMTDRWQASVVSVGSSDVSGIDAQLISGKHIKGHVFGPTGTALSGVDVYAEGSTYGSSTSSAADGSYSILVAPDEYWIGFETSDAYVDGYYSTYLPSTKYTTNWTARTAVTMAAADVAGIDVRVTQARHIKGKVSGLRSGTYAWVQASSPSFHGSAQTDSSGTYTMSVPSDTYQVFVMPSFGVAGYYKSPSGLTNHAASASDVVVGSSDVTLNVTVPSGHSIKGTVTQSGAPLSGIRVEADAGDYTTAVATNAAGAYEIPVSAGSYTISVYDYAGTYLSGYYRTGGFTVDETQATPVAVGSSDVTVNVAIPTSGRVTGKITSTDPSGRLGAYARISVVSSGYAVQSYTGAGGTYSVPVPAGSYTVAVYDEGYAFQPAYYRPSGSTSDPTLAAAVTVGSATVSGINMTMTTWPKVSRLAGADRFATAAAVSRASFPRLVEVAYIANSKDFPDALAGAAAAGWNYGPVLLADATGPLNAATAAELARVQPYRIVVLGGTGVISTAVETSLRPYARGHLVERYAGPNRFATAADVSAETFSRNADVVYVVNGYNFPDALAAASAAGYIAGPVLLTSPTGPLDATVKAELTRLRPYRIVVVGGTAAVSDSVKAALVAYSRSGVVTRFAGSSRFATAAAVSKATFPPYQIAYVANGYAFPDALSGAAAAGYVYGPVLLTSTNGPLDTATRTEFLRLKPFRVVVLGGTGAVSDDVAQGLVKYATGHP